MSFAVLQFAVFCEDVCHISFELMPKKHKGHFVLERFARHFCFRFVKSLSWSGPYGFKR